MPWRSYLQTYQHDPNMSLYYVLLRLWVTGVGDGEVAVRSLSVVFAAGSVVATYAVGVRLDGPRAGLTAAIVLAANAFLVEYAQEARGYTLFLLLSTLSMYVFVRAIDTHRAGHFAVLGIVNALLAYAHILGFFVVLAQAVSIVFLPRGAVPWRRALASALLTALLALPLIGPVVAGMSAVDQTGSWAPEASGQAAFEFFVQLTSGTEEAGWLFAIHVLAVVVAGVAAAGVVRRRGRSLEGWRHMLPFCWLCVPVACVYLMSLSVPAFLPRYMVSTLAALAILTGAGLSSFRARALLAVGTLLIVVLSVQSVADNHRDRSHEDWKSAAGHVAQHAEDGDAILFYNLLGQLPFEFYYRKVPGRAEALTSVFPRPFGSGFWIHTDVSQPDPTGAAIAEVARTHRRLWVVLYTYPPVMQINGWDERLVLDRIEASYSDRSSEAFATVTVKLYEARRP
jgi:mannosyltransferase